MRHWLWLILLVPSLSWAQSAPDVAQMFANFKDSSVSLINLVRWAALPIGLVVSFQALLKFKEYSEGGGRVKLSTPVFMAAIGAFLIWFPLSANIATQTLALGANTGTLLTAVPDAGGVPGMGAALEGVIMFIKLIGHIAFFRGLLMLKEVAEGNHQASVGRALTHIGGGAAAINLQAFVLVLANSVTPGLPIPGFGG
jgi:hypothetical protein